MTERITFSRGSTFDRTLKAYADLTGIRYTCTKTWSTSVSIVGHPTPVRGRAAVCDVLHG